MNQTSYILLAVALLLLLVLVTGCGGSYRQLLKKIPHAEFESFKYTRGGNVSSARIECEGAKLDGNGLTIKRVYINESLPWVTFDAELKGYHRKFKGDQPEKLVDAIK